jgi:hypothetical protein
MNMLPQSAPLVRMADDNEDIDDNWISRARKKFGSLDPSEKKLCENIFKGQRADYRVDSANPESKRLNSPASEAEWGPDRTLRAEVVKWLCETSRFWNPIGGGVIDIRGAMIKGELRLDNLSIDVVLRFLRCCFEGTIFLRNATLRTIDLEGTYVFPTKVDDNSKKGTRCITATEANINGSVRLNDGFCAYGTVNFDNSRVNGNFQCSGSKFVNRDYPAFTARGAHIVGDLSFENRFKPIGDIDLRRIRVDGRLNIDPAVESSKVDGPPNIDHAIESSLPEKQGKLDLRFAQIGTLYHNWPVWPEKGHLFLNGLVYNALGRKDTEPKQIHDAGWLQMQAQNGFSAQPYEQLANVLRTTGDERAAKRVLIAKQDDYRKRGDLRWFGKMWNAILGVTIAHGYEPHRALVWMLCVVILGCGVFGWAKHKGIMKEIVKDIPPENYPSFNAFAYSLDSFLPIVDLKQKGYWLPNTNLPDNAQVPFVGKQVKWGAIVRAYLWLHIILGWLFTSLWVAGFTGLVRSSAKD